MFRLLNWMLLLALAGLGTACNQEKPAAAQARVSAPASAVLDANYQYYQVNGVVKEVQPQKKTITISHEEVPNYMPAMTMPFDVKDTNELRGLQPNDHVSFRLIASDKDAWIDHLKKLDAPNTAQAPAVRPPTRPSVIVARDVEPLKVGDPLPEYHFTNELGQAVSTSQFKGQALAFTFIFTRCPYPTFCPLMSNHFDETRKKLAALPNGPTNWHLFTISFDPEHDTPPVLKAYAQRYHYDPAHWSFLTGDIVEIMALADQVGETFWHEGNSITHNLRTVVIDAQGRVQRIIPENKWTSDELAEEIVKGAAIKN